MVVIANSHSSCYCFQGVLSHAVHFELLKVTVVVQERANDQFLFRKRVSGDPYNTFTVTVSVGQIKSSSRAH